MFAAFVLLATQTVSLHPTDDIWIYHFAADPASDPYLRCWGAEGLSSADPEIADGGSWSVMKFDISKLPEGKLETAELTLNFVSNPNIDEAFSKQFPIQIRSVTPKFQEKAFDVNNAESIRPKPDKKLLLASGPAVTTNENGPTKITFKLNNEDGNFIAALEEARKSPTKELAFAITTALTPDGSGDSMLYKFYSTNSGETTKPTLTFKFE